MKSFSDLSATERAIILGLVGGSATALVVVAFTTHRLGQISRQGIPVQLTMDEPTRNLVSSVTTDTANAINQLSSQGIPVRVDLFNKEGRRSS